MLAKSMKTRGFDSLIVAEPWAVKYLTGIWNEPYERMYALLVSEGKTLLFANKLFNIPQDLTEEQGMEILWFSDTDSPVKLMSEKTASFKTVGVDKTWSARFLLPLMELSPKTKFLLDTSCVDNLRAIKDQEEIRLMKEASRVNDLCMEKAIRFVKERHEKQIPTTEKEVAAFIEEQFILEGAQGPSFETIVSFGEHGADPHHSPDHTLLNENDVVLIDMGCRKDGYCSDMTRTFFAGNPTQEQKKVLDIVVNANLAAEKIIRPGIPFCQIDEAARSYIQSFGYGEFFTHRLGHFIGQTDHEAGDVSSTNTALTEPGMIFSIEPGIYLPGKFGIRIEDLLLVTEDGCQILNHVEKSTGNY